MKLGIFAKTFPGTTAEEVLLAAAAAGFSEVQYNMACSGLPAMPDTISQEQARSVKNAASSFDIGVAAVSGTFNMIHPDRAIVEQGIRRLEVIASRCKDMGTRLITLCTGTRDAEDQWRHHPDNASPEAWRDLLAAMESALAVAEKHDVLLGVEPELANVVSSAEQAHHLIKDMNNSRLKIVLDAANLFEVADLEDQRRIVSTAIDLLAEHIAMAHAKDRAADGAFVAAGEGVLDYSHYLRCLRSSGFTGPLITHGLSAEEAPGVAQFLKQHVFAAGKWPM